LYGGIVSAQYTGAALLGAMLLIMVGGGVPVTLASTLLAIGWILYLGT
jgi:hypothetical protein|tara:strand:- start:2369 stop:2512 length:144 start_codon:yes stop_codon:yes gene_type:complete